ncbi:hypothetical protein DOY81_013059 [Sarcophaga bullata]|nr:hypothetical protein DOY81_013059 [Sarcophaga bullata]
MVPPKESIDLECFLVTKHSWKGKYKRILAIGNVGISTYNPDKLDLTNRWSYSDIVSAAPTKTSNRFTAYKYHWSGISLPTMLEVTPCSLDQLDPTTNEILASYMYKDIEGIIGRYNYHVNDCNSLYKQHTPRHPESSKTCTVLIDTTL